MWDTDKKGRHLYGIQQAFGSLLSGGVLSAAARAQWFKINSVFGERSGN